MIVLAGIVIAVATFANNQEESPLIWGVIALVFALVGGIVGSIFGQLGGGLLAFGLMQLKIAKFG